MPDNLPELRDIHLPEGVSAWPPAYGWWVILAAVIIGWISVKLIRQIIRKSRKKYALQLLAQYPMNDIFAAREISKILRRICVLKYKSAAALFGQAWLDFLNNHAKHKIYGRTAELLINAPYINPESNDYNSNEVDELREFCRDWIGENL